LSSCAAAPLTGGQGLTALPVGGSGGRAGSPLPASSLQQNESGAKRHVNCPPPPHLSTSSPQVTCTLRQHDYGIGITVANHVAAGFALADNGLPCAEPGVGMESVRRIVEKRKGTWAYDLKDGVLTCQVVLIFGE